MYRLTPKFNGEVPVFARLWPVRVRVSFMTGAVWSAILATAGLLVLDLSQLATSAGRAHGHAHCSCFVAALSKGPAEVATTLKQGQPCYVVSEMHWSA